MSGNVREIIESHHCFCEVSPYYIVSEDRPVEGAVSVRRVHAGFDLDIYGVKMSRQPDPAGGVLAGLHQTQRSCRRGAA